MTVALAEPQLQVDFDGPPTEPPKPPVIASSDEFPDKIKELGDQIAKLTLQESVELSKYMEENHGWREQSA